MRWMNNRLLLGPFLGREYLAVTADTSIAEYKMTIRIDVLYDGLQRINFLNLTGSVNHDPFPAARDLGGPTENGGLNRHKPVIIRKAKRPGRRRMIAERAQDDHAEDHGDHQRDKNFGLP